MLDGDFARRYTGERCLWSVFRCGVLPAQERPAGRLSGTREVWNRQHGTPLLRLMLTRIFLTRNRRS